MSDWIIRREVSSTESGSEWKLRALEDDEERGSLCIKLPGIQPAARFWYRVGVTSHGAPEIGIHRLQRTLTLCSDLIGTIELAQPEARDVLTASLLLHAAQFWLGLESQPGHVFLEMAAFTHAVSPGTASSRLDARFFDEISRHFLPAGRSSLEESATTWPGHLTGLLPRHPIFLSLLSAELNAVMGKPAADMAHWVEALRWHRLVPDAWLNVLDGGPVYQGQLVDELQSARAAPREVHAAAASRPDARPPETVLVQDADGEVLHLMPAWMDGDRIAFAGDFARANQGLRRSCMTIRLPERT